MARFPGQKDHILNAACPAEHIHRLNTGDLVAEAVQQRGKVAAHGLRRGVIRAEDDEGCVRLLPERSRHVGAAGGADSPSASPSATWSTMSESIERIWPSVTA